MLKAIAIIREKCAIISKDRNCCLLQLQIKEIHVLTISDTNRMCRMRTQGASIGTDDTLANLTRPKYNRFGTTHTFF